MNEPHHLVEMPRGGRIALHRLESRRPAGLPLIIAHGTISNSETVRTLGAFLSDQGFDCWLLEWGGHGHSKAGSRKQNCEYPAFHDLPTAVDTVLAATQQPQLFWVAHSGGGHLPLMYLARHPDRQSHFAGIVTLGTQSTRAAIRLRDRFAGVVLIGITNLLNRTPKIILPLGNEPEPTRLLSQWAVWNLKQRWLGTDGFDYMAGLSQLTVPVKVVAGVRDVVAPADGCREIYEAVGSVDKIWTLCGQEFGFSKDFGHGELVRGKAARSELFPRIEYWLRERCASTSESTTAAPRPTDQ